MKLKYLQVSENNDLARASLRWKSTVEWRKHDKIDGILSHPPENFEIIKRYFKHYFHLLDKNGNMVYYEMPG